MKRKNIQNNSGIEICDSIVMSVKKETRGSAKACCGFDSCYRICFGYYVIFENVRFQISFIYPYRGGCYSVSFLYYDFRN